MSEVNSWIHKGKPDRPDWMKPYLVGLPEANTSFLIRTKLGQARVHERAMVFEWSGNAYTCDPSEARSLLAELMAADAPPPPRERSIGPVAAANVAERDDDTDDITRRLRGEVVAAKARPAPSKVDAPSRRRFPPQKGMPPSIEMRHPGELQIDDSYQRSIDTGPSRSLINKIANEWDWRMCMPLVVSRRDDGLYVIDGQHRQAAARKRGDIQYLPCCIARYESVAEEAAMFVAINRARRAMNRLDDFHAAQAGADPDAVAIAALIEGVGFTVSRRTGAATWVPGEVAFTSAIRNVRRRHGDSVPAQALRMMADAFPGQRLVAGSPIFTAICAVLVSPPEPFDPSRLEAALKLFDMAGWATFLSESAGGSDRHKHLREMLLAAYEDVAKAAA